MLFKNTLAALVLAPIIAAALPAMAFPRYGVTALSAGTNPYGINSAGQIVGDVANNVGMQGFVWSNGTLVPLGAPGAEYAVGRAINSSGVVAGYSVLAIDAFRSFTYSAGVTQDLNIFSSTYHYATGINDLGNVVGTYATPAAATRAFLYANGMATDLGHLGGDFAAANAVNSAGHVVGFSALSDAPYHAHAFLYAGGAMRDLGAFPDASLSEATAINDHDQITGQGWVEGNFHAFLYENGVLNDLGTLGGRQSYARGINGLGQIVGYSDLTGDLEAAAWLYEGGAMVNLNTLIDPASGWTLYQASGINDSGQIAAYGCHSNGACGGVLLDLAPVPEPGTFAMLLLGLGVLGWSRELVRRSRAPA